MVSNLTFGQSNYYPIVKNAKWGAIDSLGRIVIAPQYQHIDPFQNGIAKAKKRWLYGLIDAKENVRINFIYKNLTLEKSTTVSTTSLPDNVNLYRAKSESGLGYITSEGEKLSSFNYELLELLENDYYKYEIGGLKGIGKLGQDPITANKFQHVSQLENYFLGYNDKLITIIDTLGNEIYTGKDGLVSEAAGCFLFTRPDTMEIVSKSGEVTLFGDYEILSQLSFNGNNLIVQDLIQIKDDEEVGYFSLSKAKWIMKGSFDAMSICGDYYVVKKDGKYGVVDTSENLIAPCRYDDITCQPNFFVVEINKKTGILSTSGKEILKTAYDGVYFSSPVFIYHKDKKIGLLNQAGKVLTRIKYDNIKTTSLKSYLYTDESMTKYSFDSKGNILDEKVFTNFIQISSRMVFPKKIPSANRPLNTSIFDVAIDEPKMGWYEDSVQIKRKGKMVFARKWGLKINDSIAVKPQYLEIQVLNDSISFAYRMRIKDGGSRKSLPSKYFINYTMRFDIINHLSGTVIQKNVNNLCYSDWNERRNQTGYSLRMLSSKGISIVDSAFNTVQKEVYFADQIKEDRRAFGVESSNVKEPFFQKEISTVTYSEFVNVFPPVYHKATKEGYFNTKSVKFGYADNQGQTIIEPAFEEAKNFKNGIGIVKNGKKHGAVNFDSLIVPVQYATARPKVVGKDTLVLVSNDPSNKTILIDTLANSRASGFKSICINSRGDLIAKSDYYGILSPDLTWKSKPMFVSPPKTLGEHILFRQKKLGVADYHGNVLADPVFKEISSFQNGLVVTGKKSQKGLAEVDGTIILKQFYKDIKVTPNYVLASRRNSTAMYNREGELISNRKCNFVDVDENSGNFLFQKGKNTTIVNKAKKTKTKFKKLVGTTLLDSSIIYKTNSFVGLLAMDRTSLIPAKYQEIINFDDSTYLVKVNKIKGLYNREGVELLSCHYAHIVKVAPDVYAGFGGRYTSKFVNSKGEVLYEDNFYDVDPMQSGLIKCKRFSGVVYLNDQFKNALNCVYEDGFSFLEGYACVRYDGTWVIINPDGDELSASSFLEIKPLGKNLFAAKESRHYGLYNNRGDMILAANYEKIKFLKGDVIQVQKLGKVGYLKSNGNWLYNPFISQEQLGSHSPLHP